MLSYRHGTRYSPFSSIIPHCPSVEQTAAVPPRYHPATAHCGCISYRTSTIGISPHAILFMRCQYLSIFLRRRLISGHLNRKEYHREEQSKNRTHRYSQHMPVRPTHRNHAQFLDCTAVLPNSHNAFDLLFLWFQ